MTPQADPSPYHDHKPLSHDLNYVVKDGIPIILQEVEHDE